MDLILKDFPHESYDYEEMHPHPQFENMLNWSVKFIC